MLCNTISFPKHQSSSSPLPMSSNQVFSEEGLIYMVLEYGDIDLARLLHNHEEARKALAAGISAEAGAADAPAKSAGGGSEQVDENFIRLWWQQMLQVRNMATAVPPYRIMEEWRREHLHVFWLDQQLPLGLLQTNCLTQHLLEPRFIHVCVARHYSQTHNTLSACNTIFTTL